MGDRKVRDTSTKEEATIVMIDAALGGNSGDAIERQEARGQQDFVNSTQLPVKGSNDEAFTKMGIRFGVAVEGELFRHADLPECWSKQPTEHSMWSKLVDRNGNERAEIFYKAAFYDRRAHMRACRRFSVRHDYEYENKNEGELRICVFDMWGGKETVVFTAEDSFTKREERWEKDDGLTNQCKAWLVENYPEWEDASACWDKE